MKLPQPTQARPVILATMVTALVVAMAPWLTGGREPVALVVTGFVLLLGALLVGRQPGGVEQLRRGPVMWGYWALMAWATTSLWWTASRYSTVIWLVTWLLAGLAFRLSYWVSASEAGKRWLIRGYLALTVVFSVVGIGMFLVGDYERLTGPIYWPNPAAAYILPAVIIALWGWFHPVSRRAQWLNGAGVTVFGTALWLTGSRGAMLVFGFVTVFMLIVSHKVKHFWIKIVFALIMVAALSTLLMWGAKLIGNHREVGPMSARLSEVATGQSQSGRDRWRYLGSALEMWFDRPVQGVGAGAYGDVHPSYQREVVSASADAHSLYIQVLAELGLIGATSLALLMLGLLGGVIRGLILRPELFPVAGGLLALLLHFGIDIDARYPALLILAAVLAGLLVRPWRPPVYQPIGWGWPTWAASVLVPVVLLYQSSVAAQRGQIAQADGEYEVAEQYFSKAGAAWLSNPDWLSAAGLNQLAQVPVLQEAKERQAVTELALNLTRQAQYRDPFDAQHWRLEGQIWWQRGELLRAESAFRRALQLDPHNHPEYAVDLARTLLSAESQDAARQVAEAMLDQYPPEVVANRQSDSTVRVNLAELQALLANLDLRSGQLESAAQRSARALDLDSTSLQAKAVIHQLELRQAAPDTAELSQ